MIVASIGLGINLLGIRLLSKVRVKNRIHDMGTHDNAVNYTSQQEGENLNVHGAYLEVLADTIGSAGVIAAGIIIQTTGLYLADPLISIGMWY